jgi:hypothetical protein
MNDFEKAYLMSMAPKLVHWHLWYHPNMKRGMTADAADDFAWKKSSPVQPQHLYARVARPSKSPRDTYWDQPQVKSTNVQRNLETLLEIVREEARDSGCSPRIIFKRRFGPMEWSAETVTELSDEHTGFAPWFFLDDNLAQNYLKGDGGYALVLAPGPKYGFTLIHADVRKTIEVNEDAQRKESRFILRDETGFTHHPTLKAAISDGICVNNLLDPAKAMAMFENLEPCCLSLLSLWDEY